ncbi:LuxR C-terminal-related transcriptional regulator [Myroides sp. C1519]
MGSKNKLYHSLIVVCSIIAVIAAIPLFQICSKAFSFSTNFITTITYELCGNTCSIKTFAFTGLNSILSIKEIYLSHAMLPTILSIELNPFVAVPMVAMNYFISGLFYGMAVLCLMSTLVIYKIFKERKWRLYFIIQILITCYFIIGDVQSYTTLKPELFDNYIQTGIIIAILMLTSLLLSTYFPFKTKKLFFKYELKIFTAISLIGIAFYFSNFLANPAMSPLLTVSIVIIFALTQYCIYKLSKTGKYLLYPILIILLIKFYTICFTQTKLFESIEEFTNSISALKVVAILIILFSIINNYVLIKKFQNRNIENQVVISQYVALLKNYHELLIEEKKAKAIKEAETVSLKDHQENLCEYLKANYKLTERELHVLYHIWDGMSNKEIASELNISLSTTKYHISNIYLKLNVNSRPQVFALKDW